MRARAKRGIALSRRERWAEAVGDLETAFYQDASDAEAANSLAVVLTHLDRYGDAIIVLKTAIARQPDDVTLARTLAGLLATAPTPDLRDAQLALRLAQEVSARTNNEDPRALDILSEAYAANGQLDLARAIALRGRTLAHASRDPEVAALLDARVRSLQPR
jgi:tetratricopeptide (TPR) repeat protein